MRSLMKFVVLVLLLFAPTVLIAADLQKGLAAYDVGDYETALAECLPLAEEGNATAQFCIGRMYANGFGVMMDDAEALKWYGLAADSGHAEAQFNLAVMHANGWGVPMNDAEAARLYRLSAEQGFVQAMLSLAYVSYRGIGTEESYVEGYKWYHIAAQLGDLTAESRRGDLEENMSPDDVQSAQGMALRWLEENEGKTLQAGRIE